ncbi:MAG: PD-(D/E)XK nuclease family transposase [Prevotellaceae bacterium]|jgi:predicted transposase/invertase (TIGR01784 family)|nr:PD-(D/E)XK nuclease family transposase [Prevotellaceae bacterium]
MKNKGKNSGKKKSDKKSVGVFINPRTDFGFKKIFNIPKMMASFSNEVISRRVKDFHINSLSYLSVEHLGDNEEERRIIVDSRCQTDKGEDILIEMQYARPDNFFERLIYYCFYLLRGQIPPRKRKGKNDKQPEDQTPAWHYDLKAIYIIAIVNFPMIKGEASKDVVIDWIRLKSEETNQTASYKLNFIIVDLTKFNKKSEELKTKEDFWLYTLKWAETLEERPAEINDELFIDLYDNILPTNKLTPKEMKAYDISLVNMKNMGLFTSYSRKEGIEIGEQRGIQIGEQRGIQIGEQRGEERGIGIGERKRNLQIVLNAANKGMSIEVISEITNLSREQVCEILNSNSEE